MTDSLLVPTPLGKARVVADLAQSPVATVVLGHGAGGGIDATDLVALADGLPPRRVSVLRVEQPWRVRGGRVAPAPPRLDIGWLAVFDQLRAQLPTWVRGPLIVGGRSAGARVACRTATVLGAAGVVALSFPLHPPGRPDKSRLPELAGVQVPVLVVQGGHDPFGRPAEFPAGTAIHVVPAGDHSLAVPRRGPVTSAEAMSALVEAVRGWVGTLEW